MKKSLDSRDCWPSVFERFSRSGASEPIAIPKNPIRSRGNNRGWQVCTPPPCVADWANSERMGVVAEIRSIRKAWKPSPVLDALASTDLACTPMLQYPLVIVPTAASMEADSTIHCCDVETTAYFKESAASEAEASAAESSVAPHGRNYAWAELMKRV